MGQSLRFLARVSMTGKLFSKLNRVAGENGILHTGMDAPTLKLLLVRQGQFLSRHLLPE
jgi:hypothetical protein